MLYVLLIILVLICWFLCKRYGTLGVVLIICSIFYFLSMEEHADLSNELSNIVNFGRLKRVAAGIVFGSNGKLDPIKEIKESIELGRLKNAKTILEQKINTFLATHKNGSAQRIIDQVSDFVKRSDEKFIQNDKILGSLEKNFDPLHYSPNSAYMFSKVTDLAKNNALLQATANDNWL